MAATLHESPMVSLLEEGEDFAFASEEPNSKRMRVTHSKHVELANNGLVKGSPSLTRPIKQQSTAASAMGAATLYTGMRVRLHGFDERPHLNGVTGQLLGFHAVHARWLVSLDNGSQKLILSANLLPEVPTPVSKAMVTADTPVDGTVTVSTLAKANGDTIVTSLSTTGTLPISDCVKAHFQFTRREALRRIEELTAKTCAQVSHLRSDVDQRCSKHQQHLLQYCQMSKPTTPDQQLARNNVREELQEVGHAVLTSMQRLLVVLSEPTAALDSLEADLLGKIDSTMDMLAQLRLDTVASFRDYAEKLEVDRTATESAITALAPGVNNLDKFMQCVSQEMQTEKARADQISTERLENLQMEENAFVEANECPTRNRRYAKVQEDLAALTRLLDEQATTDASYMDMMHAWSSMLKSLPSKQQQQPHRVPAKRTFWGHLKCSARAVQTST